MNLNDLNALKCRIEDEHRIKVMHSFEPYSETLEPPYDSYIQALHYHHHCTRCHINLDLNYFNMDEPTTIAYSFNFVYIFPMIDNM